MTQPMIFFTPSYLGDLERLVWMRRSLEHFYDGNCRHIVAVPRKDKTAFSRALGRSDIELVSQESLVDACFYPDRLYRIVDKLFPQQTWRFATRAGKPGWIIQQIVKFSSHRFAMGGPIVFLDSDIFFYRRFNRADLGIANTERCLVRRLPETEGAKHRHHIAQSRRLLGLSPGQTDTTYMGYPAIWHGDWVEKLLRHIESRSGKSWQYTLFEADFNISEYTIYGVYVDELLKPPGLNIREEPFNLIAWDAASFQSLKARVFNGPPLPETRLSLTIQSNIGIAVDEYTDMLKHLLIQSEQ
jgi:hypothetical protein